MAVCDAALELALLYHLLNVCERVILGVEYWYDFSSFLPTLLLHSFALLSIVFLPVPLCNCLLFWCLLIPGMLILHSAPGHPPARNVRDMFGGLLQLRFLQISGENQLMISWYLTRGMAHGYGLGLEVMVMKEVRKHSGHFLLQALFISDPASVMLMPHFLFALCVSSVSLLLFLLAFWILLSFVLVFIFSLFGSPLPALFCLHFGSIRFKLC